jgi:hypothetical protein
MPTEAARQALSILRDGSQFQWYAIPLVAFAVYVYVVELERRNFSVVLGGLAFWGMDWINEICNGLVFHFTNYAPVWGAPGHTAFLILIGINLEITVTFAALGVIACKLLPAARGLKIIGVPNRWFITAVASAACVGVEYLLHGCGALTWDWWWWNVRAPYLIWLLGYVPFFAVAFWVHDMADTRRQAGTVSALLSFDFASIVLFACVLGWI